MTVHKLKSKFITVFPLFLLPINHHLLNSIETQHLKFMSSFLLSAPYQLMLTPFNSEKYLSFQSLNLLLFGSHLRAHNDHEQIIKANI